MAVLLGVIIAVFLTVGTVLLYETGGWQVLIVLGIVAAVAICSWLIARKAPLAEVQAPSSSPSDLMRQREGSERPEGLQPGQVGRVVAIAVATLVTAATVVGLVLLLGLLVPSTSAPSPGGRPVAALGAVLLVLIGVVIILFTVIVILMEISYIVRLGEKVVRQVKASTTDSQETEGSQAPERPEERPS
jgi:hypothetical protein